MGWSITLGKILGIKIRLHLTFLLLLAWIGIIYFLQGGWAEAISGTVFLLLLFGCVLLHELGHALAARRYGIKTPDITLLPIGGVARLQRMPDKPGAEFVVAIAGPLVNLVLAFIFLAALGRPTEFGQVEYLTDPDASLVAKLAWVNQVLFVFNLIPAFPMDGGRILRAGLASFLSYQRATRIAAGVGQALAFVFGFIGLLYNPILIFIALFVYIGAAQEASLAQMKDLARGLSVADAMVTEFVTLPQEATLKDATDALLRTSQHEFPILREDGELLGILARQDLVDGLKQHGTQTPATDLMRSDMPTVFPDTDFEEAFNLMQERGSPALPVKDESGRLVGLITPENVGELVMVRSVLRDGVEPAWRASHVGRAPVGRT